jgi:photosystem II stability/assembly factor-like uncharacterized protein
VPRALRPVVVLGLALLCVGTTPAEAATTPWSPVASPWGSSWAVNDVYAFGATGLAAAGDDGHIGITRDGGGSWSVVVPGGLESAVLTSIAVDSFGHGVVVSGGVLRVRDDWVSAWHKPSYNGPAPREAINDVALRGSLGVAVGDDGLILTSEDAGATWSTPDSPTSSSLTSVAIAGDGTAVAGSAAGEILVGGAVDWAIVGTVAGRVTSVSASTDPAWGDGQPDLFAATGGDVLGSDDALTFTSLPGLPDLSSQSWPAMAWPGLPDGSLVLAGSPNTGFFEPVTQLWLSGSTGLNGTACAVAPGSQSVAYVLGTDSRLVRTLSAGREPAAIRLSRARILVGASSRLTATVRVGAPGVVRLRQRVPGRSWSTVQKVSWTSADWGRSLSFLLKPRLTHEYRLDFEYGQTTTALTGPAKIVVTPKISTTTASLSLRVGAVYRVSGSVTPTLRGETVYLYTDRGGSWRPVSLGGSVSLRDGRTWASRQFGTPKAETYHLRARLRSTSTHGEAWSRIVTITVR